MSPEAGRGDFGMSKDGTTLITVEGRVDTTPTPMKLTVIRSYKWSNDTESWYKVGNDIIGGRFYDGYNNAYDNEQYNRYGLGRHKILSLCWTR